MSEARKNDPSISEDDHGTSIEKTLKDFEALVTDLARPTYLFRLYVSGTSSRSAMAIANVRQICEQHLAGHYELEVIDVYQQAAATKTAQIIAVPTLIKEVPLPAQRFVGDMSNTERIVVGLNLKH
jgi:circadian clock protein KaiB